MNIKILTPEIVVFEGEVDSVLLPGEMGEFHILNNHAAVVSSLKMGKVKLVTRSIENENQANFSLRILQTIIFHLKLMEEL